MPAILLSLERESFNGGCRSLEVAVEYSYTGPSRGAREPRTGLQLEPDEPDSIEIESVTDEDGAEVELTPREAERAEEACWEDARQRRDEALIDRYEREKD